MTDPPVPTPPPIPTAIYGMFKTQALYVAAKLGIADSVADGPLSADELAHECGAHPRSLRRLMRYLVGEGFFERTADGRFSLNASADLLREDAEGSYRSMALFYGSPAVWRGWGHLLEAVQQGESGFAAAHGEGFFAFISTHPDDAEVANAFMTSMVARRPPLHLHDFSGATTVVDVGGGEGATIASVLQAHAHLRGILLDMPEVASAARRTLAVAGVEDRCQVIAGSIFDDVPSGGDVYVLSNILHDWDDEDATRILSACRAAMQPGHQLLVSEAIVSDDNEPSLAKTVDMQMMAIAGGVQRTLTELQTLFGQTGFGAGRTVPPGLLLTVAL
jgi:hypothetical protein